MLTIQPTVERAVLLQVFYFVMLLILQLIYTACRLAHLTKSRHDPVDPTMDGSVNPVNQLNYLMQIEWIVI